MSARPMKTCLKNDLHKKWFTWRKLVPGRRVTRLPSYPAERANFSYIPLQILANFYMRSKKLARLEEWLAWTKRVTLCEGRDTLLAGPSFLQIIPLARPAGSTWSENARALLSALGSDKRVNFFFLIEVLARFDSAGGLEKGGGVTVSFPGQLSFIARGQ